uniref:ORF47 n=1 Tax=Erwinia amylovora TaxID=552 RepID=Q6TFU8_ERWAM|nr:ORF47 [Erwinia amylovora]
MQTVMHSRSICNYRKSPFGILSNSLPVRISTRRCSAAVSKRINSVAGRTSRFESTYVSSESSFMKRLTVCSQSSADFIFFELIVAHLGKRCRSATFSCPGYGLSINFDPVLHFSKSGFTFRGRTKEIFEDLESFISRNIVFFHEPLCGCSFLFSGLLFFLKFLDHSLCNVGPHINELFKVFWRDFAQNGGGFSSFAHDNCTGFVIIMFAHVYLIVH